jgi:hypothetical protein
LKPRLRRLPDGLIVVYATASIREREPAWFPHGSGRLLFSRTLEFIMSHRPRLEASRLAYQRAMKVMPGGNTRSSVYEAPFPIYLREGRGAFVTDLDGNNYLDLQNNFTTLIHGHGHLANRSVVASASPTRQRARSNSPNSSARACPISSMSDSPTPARKR